MKGASIKERLTSLRRSSVLNGQKRRAWFLLALFLFLLMVSEPHLLAQNRKKGAVARSQNKKDEAAEQLAKTREEFKRATDEYKKSLEELIAFYEKDWSERQAEMRWRAREWR